MRKKLTAGVLTAALLAWLLLLPASAADTALSVGAPAALPRAGEAFEVTVDVSGNPGICALQFTLAYDRDAVECTGAKAGNVTSSMLYVANSAAREGVAVAAASVSPAGGDGALLVANFRAKKDLEALSFTLAGASLSDEQGREIPFAVSGAALAPREEAPRPAERTAPAQPEETTAPARSAQPAEAPAAGAASEEAAPAYPDTRGHWAQEWIAEASRRGLFGGDGQGNFRPDDRITRGDFVLVLWRMAGQPVPSGPAPFADVPAEKYYAGAVAWAYEKGYVNGKGEGFAPGDSLTRQEAMKLLHGFAGSPTGMELAFTGVYDEYFADSGEVASWAKPAVYWAYYEGIISGTGDHTLGARDTATRAQLAKILVGYLEKNEQGGNQ